MKRILSIDGGGIRGIFAIAVLERIEELLRDYYRGDKPGFVLSDHFDFIGGTSTGAIIAALLSKGLSVRAIRETYEQLGPLVFRRKPLWQSWRSFYGSAQFASFLKEAFREPDRSHMTLGSPQLKTALMLVMRNGTTGSTWPVTNCPEARFNRRTPGGPPTNLDLPLWQLIRASAAAPAYFPSELITLHSLTGEEVEFEFIDGGVTPYANPALAMYLAATHPAYGMGYETGIDNLFLCSVGTGSLVGRYRPGDLGKINVIGGALRSLRALIDSVTLEQDKLCRLLGRCLHGSPIDSELGDLTGSGEDRFLYCRYQHEFTDLEKERCRRATGSSHPFELDDLASVPELLRVGREYAEGVVRIDHLR